MEVITDPLIGYHRHIVPRANSSYFKLLAHISGKGRMIKVGERAIIKTTSGLAEGWIVKVTLPEGSEHRRVTVVTRHGGELKRHRRFSDEVRGGFAKET